MNKFAEQFNRDVAIRYQQKLAEIEKVAMNPSTYLKAVNNGNANEVASSLAKLRSLFGFSPRDFRNAQLDLVNNARGLSDSLFNSIQDNLTERLPIWLGGKR